LVHHYFGTKEGLFQAAVDVPIDSKALTARIVAGGPAEAPRRLVETFIGTWDDPTTGPAMVGFLRRVVADEESRDLIRDFIGTTVLRTAAAALLADLDPVEARARITLVVGQMLGLVVLRTLLRVEPIASMSVDALSAAVAPTIARYLHGDDLVLDLTPGRLGGSDSSGSRSS